MHLEASMLFSIQPGHGDVKEEVTSQGLGAGELKGQPEIEVHKHSATHF